ncbi:MAG: type II toxin-antitoxin system RelE/ParE family toxin [Pseudolabrys sp.]
MKIIFSEEADLDLLHIHTYLAARNREAAISLANAFAIKFENLARFPFIVRNRSVFADRLRSVVVEKYVIFYQVERDRIFIVRVLDGRRDIDTEFQH